MSFIEVVLFSMSPRKSNFYFFVVVHVNFIERVWFRALNETSVQLTASQSSFHIRHELKRVITAKTNTNNDNFPPTNMSFVFAI